MINLSLESSSVTLTSVGSGENVLPYLMGYADQKVSVLIVASPGAGVATVIRDIVAALPSPSEVQSNELRLAYELAYLKWDGKRPFRAPHHTISETGLLGERGNSIRSKRSEVSLARYGCLFLEDAIEFCYRLIGPAVREGEDLGAWVVGTCAPCPCGHLYHDQRRWPCTCTTAQKSAFATRFADCVSNFHTSMHVR